MPLAIGAFLLPLNLLGILVIFNRTKTQLYVDGRDKRTA